MLYDVIKEKRGGNKNLSKYCSWYKQIRKEIENRLILSNENYYRREYSD